MQIIIYIVTSIANNYLNINCNYYTSEHIENTLHPCVNDFDLFIAKLRRLLFHWFGFLYFIIFSISDNISIDKSNLDFKIIVFIWYFGVAILYLIQK
jgi:hypothetical protein